MVEWQWHQITMPVPHHSVFSGRMPFLPPNQQHKITEGTTTYYNDNKVLTLTSHIHETLGQMLTVLLSVLRPTQPPTLNGW